MNICKKDYCKLPQFSNGYCKFHQFLRSDDKYIIQKSKKKIYKPTGEKDMFMDIWNERSHISFLSGKKLDEFENSPFFFNLFAHLFPKGKYPKERLNVDNIVLLTPEEHFLMDQGTIEQRDKYAHDNNCSWEKIYNKKEELLHGLE